VYNIFYLKVPKEGLERLPRNIQTNAVFDEEMASETVTDNLAGPLRLDVIAEMGNAIAQRFVTLACSKCYDHERSTVALFDKKEAFVALYVFQSAHFYEDYVTKEQMSGNDGRRVFNARGGCNRSMPEFHLSTSGWFPPEWHGGDSDDDDDDDKDDDDDDDSLNGETVPDHTTIFNEWKWRFWQAQMDYEWQEGWMGDVSAPHYSLIESFAGCLSPTEALFVMMHALSSDTRGIFVCTVAMFDGLASDLSNAYGHDMSGTRDYIQQHHEWRDSLEARHY
jgi:hypothetical protein